MLNLFMHETGGKKMSHLGREIKKLSVE